MKAIRYSCLRIGSEMNRYILPLPIGNDGMASRYSTAFMPEGLSASSPNTATGAPRLSLVSLSSELLVLVKLSSMNHCCCSAPKNLCSSYHVSLIL